MRVDDLRSSLFDTIQLTRVRRAALESDMRLAGKRGAVATSAPVAAAHLLAATVKQLGQIVDTEA